MPELFLRDEQKTTGEWKVELHSGRTALVIDTNAMLQYLRYMDYLPHYGKIRSSVYELGGEAVNVEEDIISGQVLIYGSPSALTVGWQRPYPDLVLWAVGTASEQVYAEPYEVKYAHRGEAIIPAVLSQTTELFGYAVQRQLQLTVELGAFSLLENFTIASLTQKILHVIALEKRQGTPIRSVSVASFRDPEARNFEQLVVKVCLDCDSDTALRIWDDLSRGIEELKEELFPHEISVLNERLGLDCEW